MAAFVAVAGGDASRGFGAISVTGSGGDWAAANPPNATLASAKVPISLAMAVWRRGMRPALIRGPGLVVTGGFLTLASA